MRRTTFGLLLTLTATGQGCSTMTVPPDDGGRGRDADSSAPSDGGSGSSLVNCSCDALRPMNETNPVCNCQTPTPGTIGHGPTIRSMEGSAYHAGFVDAAHNRLILGVRGESITGVNAGPGLWAIDLATGNRTVITGEIIDPSSGRMTTGTGPAMAGVEGVAPGSDGWYVLEYDPNSTDNPGLGSTSIQRVDPSTGNRTTVFADSVFIDPMAGGHPLSCGLGGLTTEFVLHDPGIAVGAGGELYVVAMMGGDPAGGSVPFNAVLALTAGATPACRVVSAINAGAPTTGAPSRGTGPSVGGFDWLAFVDGALWSFDSVGHAMLRIDPATGNRTIVSNPGPSGMVGTDADSANACWPTSSGGANAFAVSGGVAWSDGGEALTFTRVELSNGGRSCLGGNYTNAMGSYPYPIGSQRVESTSGIWFHPTSPLLLSAGTDTVWVIDPVRQVANILSN